MNKLLVFALNVFVDRFMEGGPLFMSLILICLILAFIFIIMGFLNIKKNVITSKKMSSLASDVSLLGLVFGFSGSVIGMITAFDSIEAMGGINITMLAAGLKVSFLTTLFGAITFILPRIGIMVLEAMRQS